MTRHVAVVTGGSRGLGRACAIFVALDARYELASARRERASRDQELRCAS